MAKIGARGAKEVARVKGHSEAGSYDMLFVLTSDGRVLSRFLGEIADGYKLVHKVKHAANMNLEFLQRYVLARGLVIVE